MAPADQPDDPAPAAGPQGAGEPEAEPDPLEGTVSWGELLAETVQRLGAAGLPNPSVEARWIVEECTGLDGADLLLGLEELATIRGVARLDALVARRCAGEPIQYVLGHWPFRSLDLLVDRRVLIPRPETEGVAGAALSLLDEVVLGRPAGHRLLAVDLGTGSGAIGLAIASERPAVDVWLTDASADALAVARANLAGLGRVGTHVRIAEGSWFSALPDELRGEIDLVVSNPPYIAAGEELDASVADWEPSSALVPGPSGLEDYRQIAAEVAGWLAPGGAVVLEIGTSQGAAVSALLAGAGLVDLEVRPDLAGHDRTVIARRPT